MRGHTETAAPPRVDLNEAAPELLSSMLPGIGPVLAERIVAFREGQGRFSDPSELARVPGIGPRLAGLLVERLSITPLAADVLSMPPDEAPGIMWGEEPSPPEPASPTMADATLPDPLADAAASGMFLFDEAPDAKPEVSAGLPSAAHDPLTEATERGVLLPDGPPAAPLSAELSAPTEPAAHWSANSSTVESERTASLIECPRVPDVALTPVPDATRASPSQEVAPETTMLRPEAAATTAPPPSPPGVSRTVSQRPQPFIAPRADDLSPAKSSGEDVDPMTVAAEAAPARAPSRTSARSRRAAMVLTAALGVLAGATFAWQSERKAAGVTQASVDHVTHEVRALRADEERTRDEMTRQAAELVRQASELQATREALAATVEAEKAAETKADVRSARITQDVADIRRAQARADARVFKLDEAIKLIDWATTTGFVRQVVSDGPTKPAVSSTPHPR